MSPLTCRCLWVCVLYNIHTVYAFAFQTWPWKQNWKLYHILVSYFNSSLFKPHEVTFLTRSHRYIHSPLTNRLNRKKKPNKLAPGSLNFFYLCQPDKIVSFCLYSTCRLIKQRLWVLNIFWNFTSYEEFLACWILTPLCSYLYRPICNVHFGLVSANLLFYMCFILKLLQGI